MAAVHPALSKSIALEALDEDMVSLLAQVDLLHKCYKEAMLDIRKLKAKLSMETQKREAAEAFAHSMEQESHRLSKAQGETFSKMVQQLECRSQFEDMRHELKCLKLQLGCKEEEHTMSLRALSNKYSAEIDALQNQIRQSQDELTLRDAAVAHLEQELSCLRFSMQEMQQSSEVEFQSATLKYQQEMNEMKHKLDMLTHDKNLLEDRVLQENKVLQSQLQSVEKQVITERADFEKRVRESSFSRHSEVYKQKIMRLRKENEDLRRQCFFGKLLGWGKHDNRYLYRKVTITPT
ncbi:hypothetical protein GOP47_0024316 [Adiantum capillus-veneris]|uniref:Uncharacterized protein n=1 Tax=Adiantum capillus-veneris TaxID=13818 RepID=A0A9D4U495_ADICA|nr:hypothetical protein GOP47_0024316 [Adiantum capillus-veneris]